MYPPGFARRRQTSSPCAKADGVERALRPDQIKRGRRERRGAHVGTDRVEPRGQPQRPRRRSLLHDERRVEVEGRHAPASQVRQVGRAAPWPASEVQRARLGGHVHHHGQRPARGFGVSRPAARDGLEDLEEPRPPADVPIGVFNHGRDCSPAHSGRVASPPNPQGNAVWRGGYPVGVVGLLHPADELLVDFLGVRHGDPGRTSHPAAIRRAGRWDSTPFMLIPMSTRAFEPGPIMANCFLRRRLT